jgi:hypothetical protein
LTSTIGREKKPHFPFHQNLSDVVGHFLLSPTIARHRYFPYEPNAKKCLQIKSFSLKVFFNKNILR